MIEIITAHPEFLRSSASLVLEMISVADRSLP